MAGGFTPEELEQIFAVYDADSSGGLAVDELVEMLKSLGQDQEASAQCWDADGDGQVSIGEFTSKVENLSRLDPSFTRRIVEAVRTQFVTCSELRESTSLAEFLSKHTEDQSPALPPNLAGQLLSIWSQLDFNGDGLVQTSELELYWGADSSTSETDGNLFGTLDADKALTLPQFSQWLSHVYQKAGSEYALTAFLSFVRSHSHYLHAGATPEQLLPGGVEAEQEVACALRGLPLEMRPSWLLSMTEAVHLELWRALSKLQERTAAPMPGMTALICDAVQATSVAQQAAAEPCPDGDMSAAAPILAWAIAQAEAGEAALTVDMPESKKACWVLQWGGFKKHQGSLRCDFPLPQLLHGAYWQPSTTHTLKPNMEPEFLDTLAQVTADWLLPSLCVLESSTVLLPLQQRVWHILLTFESEPWRWRAYERYSTAQQQANGVQWSTWTSRAGVAVGASCMEDALAALEGLEYPHHLPVFRVLLQQRRDSNADHVEKLLQHIASTPWARDLLQFAWGAYSNGSDLVAFLTTPLLQRILTEGFWSGELTNLQEQAVGLVRCSEACRGFGTAVNSLTLTESCAKLSCEHYGMPPDPTPELLFGINVLTPGKHKYHLYASHHVLSQQANASWVLGSTPACMSVGVPAWMEEEITGWQPAAAEMPEGGAERPRLTRASTKNQTTEFVQSVQTSLGSRRDNLEGSPSPRRQGAHSSTHQVTVADVCCGEDQQFLVADPGSSCIKIAGLDTVVSGIWPCVAIPRSDAAILSKKHDYFVGSDGHQMRGLSEILSPVGAATGSAEAHQWQAHQNEMDKLWEFIFQQSLPNWSSQGRWDGCDGFVLSQDMLATEGVQGNILGSMLETFGPPKIMLRRAPVLAFHSTGRTTGVSVHMGHNSTDVVPVFDSHLIDYGVRRSDVAGRTLTEFMAQKLLPLCSSASGQVLLWERQDYRTWVPRIKAACCSVSDNHEETQEFELPDMEKVMLGNTGRVCGELLFDPCAVNERLESSIQHTAFDCIQSLDMDIRSEMFQNVLLTGGGAMLRGIHDRLQDELAGLRGHPVRVTNCVAPMEWSPSKNACSESSCSSVVTGGLILAQLASEHDWITKAMLDEHGTKALIRALS